MSLLRRANVSEAVCVGGIFSFAGLIRTEAAVAIMTCERFWDRCHML